LADGYQIGDLAREALLLQDDVCRRSDPVSRVLLLRLLGDAGLEHDGQNICEIDIIRLLLDDASE
jgi:hypothetical protein